MDVGQMSRCIYAAGDLALISLRISLLLPPSSRGLYQHELDTSMHHPRNCGVLLAAPRRPRAARRRDVAVPCDDYFVDFSFFAVFCWEGDFASPRLGAVVYVCLYHSLLFLHPDIYPLLSYILYNVICAPVHNVDFCILIYSFPFFLWPAPQCNLPAVVLPKISSPFTCFYVFASLRLLKGSGCYCLRTARPMLGRKNNSVHEK
ncbi:hypothetical protein B0H14DRAFT_57499 [Mycena olivaceomarginata]|nr:hypothetical protein B0H14DRAFT_57499 [Mycena olivaceomarginata]